MATPLYGVSGHKLLSQKAALLDAPTLAEQNVLAETLLRFEAPALTGTLAEDAARAVALQVSYQVERGIEADVYDSLTRGSRKFDFRDAGLLHPIAAEIAEALLDDGVANDWPAITSLRR